MSSTRKATSGSPLRQERYASDPAFSTHLKASAVARKCTLMTSAAHRELAMHLQFISMQPGGLETFCTALLERFGSRVGSKTMRQQAGRKVFSAELVSRIRAELPNGENEFPLKDEEVVSFSDIFGPEPGECESDYEYSARLDSWRALRKRQAAEHPSAYSAQDFFSRCLEHAYSDLQDWLIKFCLDPAATFETPPSWFYELEQTLAEFIAECRAAHQSGKIITSIGEQINDALDYAWEEKVLVHINGIARMGKTYQIREWCSDHPGKARYVEVPPGHDDLSFFRAVARALGTACGSSMKTTQIKRQVEDAIQDSGIMLVFDEAHNALPQRHDMRTAPKRVLWIMSALVNKGVPAALVSTEQFDKYLESVVKTTGWASEQLDGRIALRLDLPAKLPRTDLIAIAQHYFPEAQKEVSSILYWYAVRSGKYIAGLESVAKRARYLARKDDRDMPNGEDLKNAIVQVDPAIARIFENEIETGKSETGKVENKPPATRLQPLCERNAQKVRYPRKGASVLS